jgi:hypothetical protein
LEKAKKLFEKRVGANTSDDHDDITEDEEYMEEIIKSKKGSSKCLLAYEPKYFSVYPEILSFRRKRSIVWHIFRSLFSC